MRTTAVLLETVMPLVANCPDDAALQQLLLGNVPDDQFESLGGHLLACPDCATRAGKLEPADELHDMAGNVCEWCWDYFLVQRPFANQLLIDPVRSTPDDRGYRVLRGGTHVDPLDAARAWFSFAKDPATFSHSGIRLARNAAPPRP